MSKVATAKPSPLRAFWLKWRFHINVLLLLVPLGFMPKYFADAALFRGDTGIGERVAGEVQVGPWSLTLAEFRNEPAQTRTAGRVFNAALCAPARPGKATTCVSVARRMRAAGDLFGRRNDGRAMPIRSERRPRRCWITMEVGRRSTGSIPLSQLRLHYCMVEQARS